MLEHDDLLVVAGQGQDRRRGDRHAGGLREVLEADRHVGAERLADLTEIIDDPVLDRRARRRGDHHAGRAGFHDGIDRALHVVDAGTRGADDHRDAAVDPVEHALGEGPGFLGGELVRLAHDPEDRHAVDAAVEIEVDQRVGAGQIECAVVGEGRCGDDEDAATVAVDHCGWHGDDSP